MKTAMTALLAAFVIIGWRLIVLGTCTYLVFWRGESGWWFLLAIFLCGGRSSDD